MAGLEELVSAVLECDALRSRSLAQDWLRENPRMDACSQPETQRPEELCIAAALVELFAIRLGQSPPPWAEQVGALDEPTFLVRSAHTMPRLREHCEQESPEPLRRRNLFAPAEFLTSA